MYRCEKCGQIFEETGTRSSFVTNDPYPMYESVSCCPHCGSDDYEEVVECPDCEEYFLPEELVLVEFEDGTEIEVCPTCYEENYFIPPEIDNDEDEEE